MRLGLDQAPGADDVASIYAGASRLRLRGFPEQVIDDLGDAGARQEDLGDAVRLQLRDILLRDDAAGDDADIARAALVQQPAELRQQRLVRARQDAHADPVDVLLDRRAHHLLGGSPQAGIDHLHAGIEQPARHHPRAHVVAVETDLGDQYPNLAAARRLRRRRIHQKSVDGTKLPNRRRQTSTISPTVA